MIQKKIPRVAPKAYEYVKEVLDFGFHNAHPVGLTASSRRGLGRSMALPIAMARQRCRALSWPPASESATRPHCAHLHRVLDAGNSPVMQCGSGRRGRGSGYVYHQHGCYPRAHYAANMGDHPILSVSICGLPAGDFREDPQAVRIGRLFCQPPRTVRLGHRLRMTCSPPCHILCMADKDRKRKDTAR